MSSKWIRSVYLMLALLLLTPVSARAEEAPSIKNIDDYFPDRVGLTWTYQGSIEEKIQQIATYTNIAAVEGTTRKDGVEVKIFSESNQANQGPAEDYFSRNEDSIVYHGGEPTTPFELRLVPYLVIQFPLAVHQTFIQVQKEGLPFGRDIDGDGIEELADVKAEVTVGDFENVSVPAGRFEKALTLKGLMVIRLTLSKNNEVVKLVDKTTNWFALNVGMIKGMESIHFPEVDGQPETATVIREVLTKFSSNDLSRPSKTP